LWSPSKNKTWGLQRYRRPTYHIGPTVKLRRQTYAQEDDADRKVFETDEEIHVEDPPSCRMFEQITLPLEATSSKTILDDGKPRARSEG
jgi:hypothetical protein